MIEVRAPLEIKADPQGGWQLIFWTLDAFNYSTPFRGMLNGIAVVLGHDANDGLSLPTYEEDEDFVEGTLLFDEAPLRVYYEHAISYLALGNDDREVLTAAAECIRRSISLI